MRNRMGPFVRLGFVSAMLAAGALGPAAGCKPAAEKRAAQQQRLADEIDSLCARIQEQQAQGLLAEAAALTDGALANPAYAEQKQRFFPFKIDLLLARDQDAAARATVLEAWTREPLLADAVFGRIHAYYQQRNNGGALAAWCLNLLEVGDALPAERRLQVMNWLLAAALAAKDQPAAQAAIDRLVDAAPPEQAAPHLQGALYGLVDSGQHALAAALTRHLAGRRPSDARYLDLIAMLDLRCALAAADWAAVPTAFGACAAQLQDDPLVRAMRATFSVLQKNSQQALVEQLSQSLLDTAAAKTNALNYAARVWVECGVARGKQHLPERLDHLLRAQVSPVQVGNLFDRYFYDLVDQPAIIRSLCALGERILAVCRDENTVNNLKVKILDGAFITENYDLAVQMLEQGIPGKDKMWHDMSLPKVKAHRAMAQNNPREAVTYFRAFMDTWIASDQQEEFDPTSGIAYSREWILGRNANRIAKLLDSIPDPAEAAKAREEAKAYYRTAIEKAKPDAEATRLILEETRDMGL